MNDDNYKMNDSLPSCPPQDVQSCTYLETHSHVHTLTPRLTLIHPRTRLYTQHTYTQVCRRGQPGWPTKGDMLGLSFKRPLLWAPTYRTARIFWALSTPANALLDSKRPHDPTFPGPKAVTCLWPWPGAKSANLPLWINLHHAVSGGSSWYCNRLLSQRTKFAHRGQFHSPGITVSPFLFLYLGSPFPNASSPIIPILAAHTLKDAGGLSSLSAESFIQMLGNDIQ